MIFARKPLEILLVAAVATNLFGLQVLPLRQDAFVGLHLWARNGPIEAVASELADEVVEDECVGTLAAVFGQYTNE